MGIEYTYKTLKMVDLIDFCTSMEFFYTGKDFEDTVAAIALPCKNADIEKAKATYNAVPENITLSEEEFTALIKALSGCGNVIMDKDITNI